MIFPIKPDPDRHVFSPGEACWYLGLSWPTVRKLIRQGRIRAQRIGRRYLIPRGACDDLLSHKETIADEAMRRLWRLK